jgi:hypothetical protein
LFVLGLQKDILQSSVFGLMKASPSFNRLHFRDAKFSFSSWKGQTSCLFFLGLGFDEEGLPLSSQILEW